MADRRVPLAIRPKLKKELDRLSMMGVITPVEEPTPWVSQIVIAHKKSGDIRVCLDPHELNKSLMREHYTLPILEDVLHELRESKVFSKADLSSGYWHVVLDQESSLLTTFQTCFGRYRFLRLPFGIKCSSEYFQKKLLEALNGLPGVQCIADDVIIHGKTTQEHDARMKMFLDRCQELGIKLNKDKLETAVDSINFMGHRISAQGLSIDPEKVSAVKEMKEPTNVTELRQFLGMINYLTKFLPNITTVIHPLQNLLKSDVTWTWSSAQQAAFEQVKKQITDTPVLAFYDPEQKLTVENDACEYGLGSVLLQEGRPVAYASRSLSETESRYAQIEKEMLAVTYGLEKFHYYTFGRDVEVITDHKPLMAINAKPLSKAPKRLQNLLLRAQKYSYTLIWKPGKSIPLADALSRAPTEKPTQEEMVGNITIQKLKDHRLDQIRGATARDDAMTSLGNVIMAGWPNDKTGLPENLIPYFSYRDELTIQDGIIYRGDRIVIPKSLQKEMKERVHTGHLGINSCLRRARDLLFWPGMSMEIRQYVETCGTCATYADKQTKESIQLTEIPSRPWQKIGSDLFTWGGHEYLITVDYHSNFFELDQLPDSTSTTVIKRMKSHFARHGIPDTIISDNGTQYTSSAFKSFSKQWGFCHETISPGNSQANGAAEAAVKIAKKLMKRSKSAGEDPFISLLNLRNTPTEGLNTSPAQRLLGRRTKSLLPTASAKLVPGYHDPRTETNLKEKRKMGASNLGGRDLRPLTLGDTVRMQPIENNKKEWKQATVSQQLNSRSFIVTTENGKCYKRNRRFLRKSVASTHSIPAITTPVESRQQPTVDTQISASEPVPSPTTPTAVSVTTPRPPPTTDTAVATPPASPAMATPKRTRYGRSIRLPPRYRDN